MTTMPLNLEGGLAARRRPQQRRSQLKVQQILESAAELLEEIPYDEVSVKLIVENAGVAASTFYGYFSDREAVFSMLGLQYAEEARTVLCGLDDSTFGSWEEAADAILDTYIVWFRERVGFRALWFSDRLDRAVLEADQHGNAEVAERMRQLLERTLGRSIDAPGSVFRFAVELSDRLLRYGFHVKISGDDETFIEIKRAVRSYLATYVN